MQSAKGLCDGYRFGDRHTQLVTRRSGSSAGGTGVGDVGHDEPFLVRLLPRPR
jgi:hypothetical protein